MLGEKDGFKYFSYTALELLKDKFDSTLVPCLTTLYKWIDKGIMLTRNIDLLVKPRRKVKRTSRNPVKVMGKNISERSHAADNRSEIGHFEVDTIQGIKGSNDKVLLVLTDRLSRYNYTFQIESKTSEAVNAAFEELKQTYGDDYTKVFKSLTADNGSEFSELNEVHPNVFFANPYSPWERGSNDNNNRIIRHHIPKGKAISSFTPEEILSINDWLNDYPRKIFGGLSAEDVYYTNLALERATSIDFFELDTMSHPSVKSKLKRVVNYYSN